VDVPPALPIPVRSAVFDTQSAYVLPADRTAIVAGAGITLIRGYGGSLHVNRGLPWGGEFGAHLGLRAPQLPEAAVSYKQQLYSGDWWWSTAWYGFAKLRQTVTAWSIEGGGGTPLTLDVSWDESSLARLHVVPQAQFSLTGPTGNTLGTGAALALVIPTGNQWDAVLQVVPWVTLGGTRSVAVDYPIRVGGIRRWRAADVALGIGLALGDSTDPRAQADVAPPRPSFFTEQLGHVSLSAGIAF